MSSPSPPSRPSISSLLGGKGGEDETTAGKTSHLISAEQVRREEGTKRAGRQMSVWFSSLQISLLLAAQRRPRPDWGCLPRAGRGVPRC